MTNAQPRGCPVRRVGRPDNRVYTACSLLSPKPDSGGGRGPAVGRGCLLEILGTGRRHRFSFCEPVVVQVLGRDSRCDFGPAERHGSRRHSEVRTLPQGFEVRDVGSLQLQPTATATCHKPPCCATATSSAIGVFARPSTDVRHRLAAAATPLGRRRRSVVRSTPARGREGRVPRPHPSRPLRLGRTTAPGWALPRTGSARARRQHLLPLHSVPPVGGQHQTSVAFGHQGGDETRGPIVDLLSAPSRTAPLR